MFKDIVLYEVGDLVINKNKDDLRVRKVSKTVMVGNPPYQILYFEDSPDDFHVANNYYPNNLELRKKYIEIEKSIYGSKPKKRTNKEPKEKSINSVDIVSSMFKTYFNPIKNG